MHLQRGVLCALLGPLQEGLSPPRVVLGRPATHLPAVLPPPAYGRLLQRLAAAGTSRPSGVVHRFSLEKIIDSQTRTGREQPPRPDREGLAVGVPPRGWACWSAGLAGVELRELLLFALLVMFEWFISCSFSIFFRLLLISCRGRLLLDLIVLGRLPRV
jgi:hypothetical protein